jgi:hypothetical protein
MAWSERGGWEAPLRMMVFRVAAPITATSNLSLTACRRGDSSFRKCHQATERFEEDPGIAPVVVPKWCRNPMKSPELP